MERSDLNIGDHIYSWRRGFITYAHHGVYVGENKVIHLTNNKQMKSSAAALSGSSIGFSVSSSRRNPGPVMIVCTDPKECGSRAPGGSSGVIISCLDCFLENGSLQRYEYGVSPEEFRIRDRGTCTVEISDPPSDVVGRATYLLRNNALGEYHLLENNCEDFAVFCKTGLKPTERDPDSFRCQVPVLLYFSSLVGSAFDRMRKGKNKISTEDDPPMNPYAKVPKSPLPNYDRPVSLPLRPRPLPNWTPLDIIVLLVFVLIFLKGLQFLIFY